MSDLEMGYDVLYRVNQGPLHLLIGRLVLSRGALSLSHSLWQAPGPDSCCMGFRNTCPLVGGRDAKMP